MESAIALALAAIIYIGIAAVLGYWGQKGLGIIILSFLALVAILLSGGGAALGYTLGAVTGAWMGLIVGILLAGVVWLIGLRSLTKVKKSGRFAANAWYSFAALSVLGYLARICTINALSMIL